MNGPPLRPFNEHVRLVGQLITKGWHDIQNRLLEFIGGTARVGLTNKKLSIHDRRRVTGAVAYVGLLKNTAFIGLNSP